MDETDLPRVLVVHRVSALIADPVLRLRRPNRVEAGADVGESAGDGVRHGQSRIEVARATDLKVEALPDPVGVVRPGAGSGLATVDLARRHRVVGVDGTTRELTHGRGLASSQATYQQTEERRNLDALHLGTSFEKNP